jgi:hypothetical protein
VLCLISSILIVVLLIPSVLFVLFFFFFHFVERIIVSHACICVRIIYKMVYSNWRAEGAQVC